MVAADAREGLRCFTYKSINRLAIFPNFAKQASTTMNNNTAHSWYGEAKDLTAKQKTFFDKIAKSKEQIDIVFDDSKYLLVRSSAGSGKSTVLRAKILYLLNNNICKPSEILYLSFNRKNVKEFRKKLEELEINPDDAKKMCRTFHSLALHIIELENGIWPCILEPVSEASDKDDDEEDEKYDHDRAEVYLSSEEFNKSIKGLKKKYLVNAERMRAGMRECPRYVTYYVDRYGIPGSCRSKIEKQIFEFLAQHGVDFAYEEPHGNMRPDFTLYSTDGRTKYYYEHYGLDNGAYRKNEESKKGLFESSDEKDRFIFTDRNDSIESIKNKLRSFIKNNGLFFSEEIVKEEKDLKNKLFTSIVQQYRMVRDTIVETGQDINDVANKILQGGNPYQKYFIRHIFKPIEEKYKKLLSDDKHINSDFAECMKSASIICGNASKAVKTGCKYKYILVDEYQDISRARFDLLKGVMNLNPRAKLIAVGDGRQSIFSFACSDLNLFVRFKDMWGKKAEIRDMSLTYRLGEPLMSISSDYIKAASDQSSYFGAVKCSPNNKTFLYFVKGNKQFACVKEAIQIIKKTNPKTKVLVLFRFNDNRDKFVKSFEPYKIKGFDKKEDGITTLHKSKGLDVDIVFIVECNKASFPYIREDFDKHPLDGLLHSIRSFSYADADEKTARLDEDRRLFYVALTRANDKVFILYEEGKESSYIKELKDYYRTRYGNPIELSTQDNDIIEKAEKYKTKWINK